MRWGMTQDKIDQLLEIMAKLRDPEGGCPWDIEQTFATIAPYTIEEAYEVADAIARGDLGDLRDELGDLLLQVVFHARMAEEAGAFAFGDVVTAICDKMVRRHPHVFGEAIVADEREQRRAWEEHKAQERANKDDAGGTRSSALDGVAVALPALMRAEKLGKRAARTGFDWPDMTGVLAKVDEEIAEVKAELAGGSQERIGEEVGDLLFACANLARRAGVDAETALRGANRRFEARFRHLESAVRVSGRDTNELALVELEALWQAAKKALSDGGKSDVVGTQEPQRRSPAR
jgi:ATP diphosphatase